MEPENESNQSLDTQAVIHPNFQNEEKLEELKTKLMKKFDLWYTWRKPLEDIWNEVYRLYRNVVEFKKTPTRAKIFIPAVFNVIEVSIPKIIGLFFGQEGGFYDCVPADVRNQPIADVIKKLMNYQLKQADIYLKFIDHVKQLLLYGTSYFYVYWKVRREWVYSRNPKSKMETAWGWMIGKKVEWTTLKEYKVVERRPEIEVLDVLDVFPDPSARSEKDAEGIFIRSWISKEEFEEMTKGKYPVFSTMNNDDMDGEKSYGYSESRQSRMSARGLSSTAEVDSADIELISYWGKWDLDGDGIREQVWIVVANRKRIVKCVRNPFDHQKVPLIRSVLFSVPLEWFGIGMIEPIIPLQHELNTIRRQRLDNVNIIINRMWKVIGGSDVDLNTLISSPNGIIIVDQENDVTSLETPNVTQSAYVEAATIQQDIDNVTAPKAVQGTPESGRLGRTAKGAQMIIGQALEKFGTINKTIEELGMKRLLRMMHQLNLQFINPTDSSDSLTGMFGSIFDKKIDAEMIRAEVDFDMVGISEMIGQEAKINQLVSFFGVFKEFLSPDTVKEIATKVYELMGFDSSKIQLATQNPTMAAPPTGMPGGNENNDLQSLLGQVQRNGGSAPIAPPQGK